MVSEAARIAMRIAVLEAHENINDELTAEHILIGLFSIDKLVNRGYERFKSREEVGPIPDNYWWSFHAENGNLNEIFHKFGLDSIKLRKSLRAYLLSQRSSDYEGAMNYRELCRTVPLISKIKQPLFEKFPELAFDTKRHFPSTGFPIRKNHKPKKLQFMVRVMK